MSLNTSVEKLAAEFKADPRNKIFINEEILISTVIEETGNEVTAKNLREVIAAFLSGNMDESQESIYDGAIYACGLSARHCFNDEPEDDIDYEVDWQEQEDGSYIAEVRPS